MNERYVQRTKNYSSYELTSTDVAGAHRKNWTIKLSKNGATKKANW